MKGCGNYDSGVKQDNRRKVFGDISRRTLDPWTANVLYLPGNRDLDRKMYDHDGFNPNRVIGVEYGMGLHAQLVRQGRPVINGDFVDVLHEWPAHRPLSVVHADLCSCLSISPMMIAVLALSSPGVAIGATVVIAMQRGREVDSTAKKVGFRRFVQRDAAHWPAGVPKGHRGWMLWELLQRTAAIGFGLADDDGNFIAGDDSLKALARAMTFWCSPKLYSYRQSPKHVWMDTIVLTAGLKFPRMADCERDTEALKDARAKITAQLAVQTQRLSGTKREAPRS